MRALVNIREPSSGTLHIRFNLDVVVCDAILLRAPNACVRRPSNTHALSKEKCYMHRFEYKNIHRMNMC